MKYISVGCQEMSNWHHLVQNMSYYGSHLWNKLPSSYKDLIDVKMFKLLISVWEGPKCSCNICNMKF